MRVVTERMHRSSWNCIWGIYFKVLRGAKIFAKFLGTIMYTYVLLRCGLTKGSLTRIPSMLYFYTEGRTKDPS
jgi:hypothetical protein